MKEIIIASKNKGKIQEFKSMLKEYDIAVLSLHDLDLPIEDIEETGESFHENARIKAETIAKIMNQAVIADDSGLEIDALDGRPGVYSARYAGEPTDDLANNQKVLDELKNIPVQNRTARFISVIALAIPDQDTYFFEGSCEGKIALEAKGDFGFGYDPIFIPDQHEVTMAQLTEQDKNTISHRANALRNFMQWLDRTESLS